MRLTTAVIAGVLGLSWVISANTTCPFTSGGELWNPHNRALPTDPNPPNITLYFTSASRPTSIIVPYAFGYPDLGPTTTEIPRVSGSLRHALDIFVVNGTVSVSEAVPFPQVTPYAGGNLSSILGYGFLPIGYGYFSVLLAPKMHLIIGDFMLHVLFGIGMIGTTPCLSRPCRPSTAQCTRSTFEIGPPYLRDGGTSPRGKNSLWSPSGIPSEIPLLVLGLMALFLTTAAVSGSGLQWSVHTAFEYVIPRSYRSTFVQGTVAFVVSLVVGELGFLCIWPRKGSPRGCPGPSRGYFAVVFRFIVWVCDGRLPTWLTATIRAGLTFLTRIVGTLRNGHLLRFGWGNPIFRWVLCSYVGLVLLMVQWSIVLAFQSLRVLSTRLRAASYTGLAWYSVWDLPNASMQDHLSGVAAVLYIDPAVVVGGATLFLYSTLVASTAVHTLFGTSLHIRLATSIRYHLSPVGVSILASYLPSVYAYTEILLHVVVWSWMSTSEVCVAMLSRYYTASVTVIIVHAFFDFSIDMWKWMCQTHLLTSTPLWLHGSRSELPWLNPPTMNLPPSPSNVYDVLLSAAGMISCVIFSDHPWSLRSSARAVVCCASLPSLPPVTWGRSPISVHTPVPWSVLGGVLAACCALLMGGSWLVACSAALGVGEGFELLASDVAVAGPLITNLYILD